MSPKKRNGKREFFELIYSKKKIREEDKQLQEWKILQIPDAMRAMKKPLSLDAPLKFEDRVTATLGDVVGDSRDADRIRNKVNFDYWLDGILAKMPKSKSKHRSLIQLLRDGCTPKQAAKKLNITKKGVSFLLKEFREQCESRGLLKYTSVRVRCVSNCSSPNCSKCYFVKRLLID